MDTDFLTQGRKWGEVDAALDHQFRLNALQLLQTLSSFSEIGLRQRLHVFLIVVI